MSRSEIKKYILTPMSSQVLLHRAGTEPENTDLYKQLPSKNITALMAGLIRNTDLWQRINQCPEERRDQKEKMEMDIQTARAHREPRERNEKAKSWKHLENRSGERVGSGSMRTYFTYIETC